MNGKGGFSGLPSFLSNPSEAQGQMFGAFTGAAASVYGTYRTMELEEKRVRTTPPAWEALATYNFFPESIPASTANFGKDPRDMATHWRPLGSACITRDMVAV
ncbi:hypothetical protein Fcan01_26946 [Folsomia candida]|uniref:Uncharacterized protein n=1 Tax=Folsomia candida TaxID=158441 RepID=A0A226CZ27_FOLCA|nr:hypothetical protein Fcan01_26946 [Folsomia candida]